MSPGAPKLGYEMPEGAYTYTTDKDIATFDFDSTSSGPMAPSTPPTSLVDFDLALGPHLRKAVSLLSIDSTGYVENPTPPTAGTHPTLDSFCQTKFGDNGIYMSI